MHLHTLGWNEIGRPHTRSHTFGRTESGVLAMLTEGLKKNKNHRKQFTETSQTRNKSNEKHVSRVSGEKKNQNRIISKHFSRVG